MTIDRNSIAIVVIAVLVLLALFSFVVW